MIRVEEAAPITWPLSGTLWPQNLDRLTLGKLDSAFTHHMYSLRLEAVPDGVVHQAPRGLQRPLAQAAFLYKRGEEIGVRDFTVGLPGGQDKVELTVVLCALRAGEVVLVHATLGYCRHLTERREF